MSISKELSVAINWPVLFGWREYSFSLRHDGATLTTLAQLFALRRALARLRRRTIIRKAQRCVRAASAPTIEDKDFLAEADKLKLEIVDPVSGADMQKLIDDLYKSSPDVLARAKEVMAAGPAASVAKPK